MKGKLYTVGIIAAIGLIGLGGFFIADKSSVYQEKDYDHLFVDLHRADIGDMYYRLMRADENGEINLKDVLNMRNAVAEQSAQKGAANWLFWEELGPNFVGGRTRSILRDNQPGNESVLYAASVAGGVFISYNLGESWEGYSSDMTSLSVGDMAQSANGTLFVGTGPGHDTYSPNSGRTGSGGYYGDGLFRRDLNGTNGLTYTRIIGPSNTTGSSWLNINRLQAHPTDDNKLYVGANHGFWVTSDAQATQPVFFNNLTGLTITDRVDDIAVSNVDGSGAVSIYVVAGATIYKLRDAGANQITLDRTINLPAGNGFISRIAIALSPSNDSVLYAAASNQNAAGSCAYGIFQSRDAGLSWTNIGPGGGSWNPYGNSLQCQSFYDNTIGIYPNDPGKIIIGGVELWGWTESKTTPGTGGWTQLATTNEQGGLTDTNYVHADKHRILVTDANTIFICSDGGIGKSIDGGKTWGQSNNGYKVTQFYSVAAAFGVNLDSLGLGTSQQVLGGTQDNGTRLLGRNPSQPDYSDEILGGDGFDCAFSNLGNLAFGTVYYGSLARLGRGGAGGGFYDNEIGTDLGCDSSCGSFYTKIAYWEKAYTEKTGDSILYFVKGDGYDAGDTIRYPSNIGNIQMDWPAPRNLANGDSLYVPDFAQSKLALSLSGNKISSRVYVCRDAANLKTVAPRWDMVAGSTSYPNPISGNILSMTFSEDGNQLFLGSLGNGTIYRIDNLQQGLDSASTDIRSTYSVLTCTRIATIPNAGQISSISIDPNNPDNLVITVAGSNSGDKVWRITDATTCLTDAAAKQSISDGLPVGLPVFSSVIAVHDNNTVVIGTEAGVYACDNAFAGAPHNWYSAYGLPKIPVYGMTQQTKRYIYDENHPPLIENAHYRAIYIGTHGRGIWKTSSLTGLEDKNKPAKPIAKREATLQFKVYPNPMNSDGSMEINMPKEDRAVVEIYDLNGRLVTTVSNRILPKGSNKLDLNVGNFRNGTYLATVKVGDELKVSKFLVIK